MIIFSYQSTINNQQIFLSLMSLTYDSRSLYFMTPEELEKAVDNFFTIASDLQKKQLRHEEQIQELIAEGRRNKRNIAELRDSIADLEDI